MSVLTCSQTYRRFVEPVVIPLEREWLFDYIIYYKEQGDTVSRVSRKRVKKTQKSVALPSLARTRPWYAKGTLAEQCGELLLSVDRVRYLAYISHSCRTGLKTREEISVKALAPNHLKAPSSDISP